MTALADLHAACAALGTRLFTVTALDQAAGLHRRVYTSHPVAYPVEGTKPLDRDAWYDTCVAARQAFVANSPDAFAGLFADHALILSLGLGACANLPVVADGMVRGTVNLLAEPGHFAPERMAFYAALVTRATPAILTALADGGPQGADAT